MSLSNLLILATILASGVLLLWLTRRLQRAEPGRLPPPLRPINSYQAINQQVGRAVESGRRLHLALGRGPLTGTATPVTIAALAVLDELAAEASAGGEMPVVTTGDGTLTPAAQDSVRLAYRRAGRSREYSSTAVEFIADNDYPISYAAGVTEAIHRTNLAGNVMVGRFGPELAIMGEAAQRANVEQIAGTDDPTGLAVGAALTENLLIGEEFLAAGAYLEGEADQVAALQTQDLLRWVVIVVIFALALVRLITS